MNPLKFLTFEKPGYLRPVSGTLLRFFGSFIVHWIVFFWFTVISCGYTMPRVDNRQEPLIKPLESLIDLNLGETGRVTLSDGSVAELTLLQISNERDSTPQNAVRRAWVTFLLNGEKITVESGNYHLPVKAGGVQLDVPVTAAYLDPAGSEGTFGPEGVIYGRAGLTGAQGDETGMEAGIERHSKRLENMDLSVVSDIGGMRSNVHAENVRNVWKLEKDARFRLWPEDSPFTEPGTFVYPVRQRLFSSATQGTNVPTFVDGGERPGRSPVYYHEGFDIGGVEGKTEVISATDGVIVSLGDMFMDDRSHPPVRPRYDVVYILDDRGWYYRYSHLKSFQTRLHPGMRISMGDKIGEIGREGTSGGWAHLHFDISMPLASGDYAVVCPFAYLWEAYLRDYDPDIIALARPHHLIYAGEEIVLDAGRSWARSGNLEYRWKLSDGRVYNEPRIAVHYDLPGSYSEILEVVDEHGNRDYDFTVIQVFDRNMEAPLPPALHVAAYPTMDIQAGDPVLFAVRAFRMEEPWGREEWDFGDGSPPAVTRSRPGDRHDPEGYAQTVHRFSHPGDYVVTVQRSNRHGQVAVSRIYVPVGSAGR